MRTEQQIKKDIRTAKAEWNNTQRGTQEWEQARQKWEALQLELGAVELKKLGITSCAS